MPRAYCYLRLSVDAWVNLAILATCGLVAAAVMTRLGSAVPVSQAPSVLQLKAGDQAERLPGIAYEDASASVLLYLRSTCRFCTESMPLYRRLRELTNPMSGLQLVAVGSESEQELNSYLAEHDLQVDRVVSFNGVVQSTPTVVLVDHSGTVTEVWLGVQQDEAAERLLQTIRSAVPG